MTWNSKRWFAIATWRGGKSFGVFGPPDILGIEARYASKSITIGLRLHKYGQLSLQAGRRQGSQCSG